MKQDLKARELRVVLDAESTLAFESMLKRIKEAVPTINVHPSQFVSFLTQTHIIKPNANKLRGKPTLTSLWQKHWNRPKNIKVKDDAGQSL